MIQLLQLLAVVVMEVAVVEDAARSVHLGGAHAEDLRCLFRPGIGRLRCLARAGIRVERPVAHLGDAIAELQLGLALAQRDVGEALVGHVLDGADDLHRRGWPVVADLLGAFVDIGDLPVGPHGSGIRGCSWRARR